MSRFHRSIAVIGLGSFGASVARELTRFGDRVLGIDASAARVALVSDVLHRAVIADARDERAMQEAGLGHYDAVVVAMASDLESNVLSVMNAHACGAATVWAKAGNATHARILESIGVDRILQPEHEFGEHIAHMLHNAAIEDYIRLAPNLHLAQVLVDADHAGLRLDGLGLLDRFELTCLGLVREGAYVPFGDRIELAEGDSLLVIGTRGHMRAFAEKL